MLNLRGIPEEAADDLRQRYGSYDWFDSIIVTRSGEILMYVKKKPEERFPASWRMVPLHIRERSQEERPSPPL